MTDRTDFDDLPEGWNVCDRCDGRIPPGETNIGTGIQWAEAELCGNCYAALVAAGMLEDREARLEAQGYEDWLRNDPGRRLAAVEARLAELEERLRRLEAAQAAAGA